MMIYQRLMLDDFIREFKSSYLKDMYSRGGLEILYRHLDRGEEAVEFDPIDITNRFSEYEGLDLVGEFVDVYDEEEWREIFGLDDEDKVDLHNLSSDEVEIAIDRLEEDGLVNVIAKDGDIYVIQDS